MKKTGKKLAAMLLIAVMVIAFLPVFNTQKVSAASGETTDCHWVSDAVWGLPNGYAVAGSTISVDSNEIRYIQDEDGSNMESPLMEFELDSIEISVSLRSADETKVIGSGTGDQLMIDVTVPEDAKEGDTIIVSAKGADGWYYIGTPIPVKPAKISEDFMKDLGSVTIDLPKNGAAYPLPSGIDMTALRNTLLIAGDSGKTGTKTKTDTVIEADLNFDSAPDLKLAKDGGKNFITVFADQLIMKAKSKTISIPVDTKFDPQNLYEEEYLKKAFPYYSKVIIKFQAREIGKGRLTVDKTSFQYNGKFQKPAVRSLQVNGINLTEGKDFTVQGARKDIGKGTLTITGKGFCKGKITKSFVINKADNPMKVKAKAPIVKYKKLKKKNQKIAAKRAVALSKAKGKVTYKKIKGHKKIKVATNGTITVKKGLKKGTYKVKIKVKAKGNAYYKALTKSVTVKVKVR